MQKLKLSAGSFLTALFVFPALCSAQSLTIVSGNGQLLCPACAGGPYHFAPLVVQVNNASGQSVGANTSVTWTATQAGSQPIPVTTMTNSSGQASYTFIGISPFFDQLQATVVATALNASVQFVETTSAPGLGGGPAVIPALDTSNGTLPTLSGTVGVTSATTITISVFSTTGPVSGIGVALEGGASTGPSVSCAPVSGQIAGAEPGLILTSSAGTAVCTPVFGGSVGTGTYKLIVGGNYVIYGPANLTVAAGVPAVIKYISGNMQNVNAGVKAPLALTAEVTDIGGNPSENAAVIWSVTGGTATLSSQVTTSPADGLVSAFVTPSAGPVQVKVALASNSSAQYTFTINVNLVITALQYVSGNNQPAANEGAAFANPLIVQVNDNGTPLEGISVNFAVTSGPATLSANSPTTNSQGQAQVTATAGATSGPVVITASVASGGTTYTEVFDLTVQPPGPQISAIANAAGYQNQYVSPCSLATIYGTQIATGLQGVAAPFIAPQTQVDNVTVQFGGMPAPILYVANINGEQSVSVQVPCTVPLGTVQMVVTADNAPSQPFAVTVSQYSPGIFQFTDTDGAVRAVLVRQDGSFITLANPARPGDTLRMFVTGLGQTTPPLFTNEFDPLAPDASGDLVPQDLPVSANVIVGVNNAGVVVLAAKYAYGMVGVYEVDFQVPANTTSTNNAPFAILVYQNSNQLFWGNGSLLPIQ
jgi:uncharacterized protein (TIGR03437 family)